MNTTPNLPPLPNPDIDKGLYDEDGYLESTVNAYALSAYRAGFNEALEQVKARIGAMQNREVK